MKQSENKWWQNGWVWGAFGCVFVSGTFGTLVAIYQWENIWIKITSGALTVLAAAMTFFCGVRAHAKQTNEIEEILLLIKGIGNELTKIENVNFTESACAVYVKLTLYAMYHANTRRAKNQIKCETISEKYPDLILIIVQTIFAAFRSDAIMGWIGDDGCIVIDEFKKEIPKDCTDGRALLRSYEHMNNYDEIKAAINRINAACELNQI